MATSVPRRSAIAAPDATGPTALARALVPQVRHLQHRVAAHLEPATPWARHLTVALRAVAPDLSRRALPGVVAEAATIGLFALRCLHAAPRGSFARPTRSADLPPAAPAAVRLLVPLLVEPSPLVDDLDAMAAHFAGQDLHTPAWLDAGPPLVHFHEHLVAALHPTRRAARGVFYTPAPVVEAMVAQVDARLRASFGLPLGLADPSPWSEVAAHLGRSVPAGIDPAHPFVGVLDPSVGTGAFLAAVVRRVHRTSMAAWAHHSAPDRQARWQSHVHHALLPNLHGVERSLPALLVAHLHLGHTLAATGATVGEGPALVCADTLAAPPPDAPARHSAPVTVLLGNPPYGRHGQQPDAPHPGGWIQSGRPTWRDGRPPLDDYAAPVRATGEGRHLKSLYNLYVYFWRWATWRVLEQGACLGVVSLVTAASFLRGPGFSGMRAHLREVADGLDVLDLEGDPRGTRASENVFDIAVAVCITTAWRAGRPRETAQVRFARVSGTRADKLAFCTTLARGAPVSWQTVEPAGTAPLLAVGTTPYTTWPRVTDLFPWQHSGVQYKRTWPIGPTPEVLARRWRALLAHPDRAGAFHETRARRIDRSVRPLPPSTTPAPPLATLPRDAPPPPCRPYAARSFDRRWALVDARLGDRLRPPLWAVSGPHQLYLSSLLTGTLGPGPAATVSAHPPDLHHFRGSYGGKDVIPLWRDAHGREANVTPGVLDVLGRHHGRPPSAPDLFAYTYAVLAQPAFTARWSAALRVPGPRVPLSADPTLFRAGVVHGRELLARHTRGSFTERPAQARRPGAARVRTPMPTALPDAWHYDPIHAQLHVGTGTIGPVPAAVVDLAVSGLGVLASWLDHRMQRRSGRRSSPLDAVRPAGWSPALTDELLELLDVLAWTVATYPTLAAWLHAVEAGPLVPARDLPLPPDAARRPPQVR